MEMLLSSWRNIILKEFVPNVAKLTLVSDPDCLLSEERLAIELVDRGFDLIEGVLIHSFFSKFINSNSMVK